MLQILTQTNINSIRYKYYYKQISTQSATNIECVVDVEIEFCFTCKDILYHSMVHSVSVYNRDQNMQLFVHFIVIILFSIVRCAPFSTNTGAEPDYLANNQRPPEPDYLTSTAG